MSIELNWDKLDPSIAFSLRDIINDKISSLPLPKFLASLHVNSFDVGSTAPEIEITDLGDPYAEFYEDNYDSDHDEHERNAAEARAVMDSSTETLRGRDAPAHAAQLDGEDFDIRSTSTQPPPYDNSPQSSPENTHGFPPHMPSHTNSHRSTPSLSGIFPMQLPRSSTLHYFHPLARQTAGLNSGLSTPGWGAPQAQSPEASEPDEHVQPARPRITPAEAEARRRVEDVQIVAKVRWKTEAIRMSISAELVINYPSAAFVTLPLSLTLTSLTFEGTAIITYMSGSSGRRVHFCFVEEGHPDAAIGASQSPTVGEILRDIKIESEIGEKEKGVLKNVGKVERFLLERLRRVVDEEFVFPSFYTFLL
ncbi:hypothetical protein SAICODRAFT_31461 [Saitoella complicata NRRL Y-17804]|uniref:Mitochondrial distribution and morphology protein 12 n=1 Tax=Saitoella complicata (strain BCRC 22490 / CBS 7301 / JCM 7358 / NBRC 10748 / NRRL Y-17804) TaxID=698492 RepID=A0A0E9NIT8_SAICN|nr:uncharacterized protein SAICODRAFT_31461 [Saitoella complicata NRRL Y-17804]ODQ51264.1 hypothetical protein SAICODRAFT_31461 [Saitoella complicata NRRL Y-17804]GAO49325.1 hypothetical protein G7K_3476-t1 [Saitoella complicata NRRL Y-17804]